MMTRLGSVQQFRLKPLAYSRHLWEDNSPKSFKCHIFKSNNADDLVFTHDGDLGMLSALAAIILLPKRNRGRSARNPIMKFVMPRNNPSLAHSLTRSLALCSPFALPLPPHPPPPPLIEILEAGHEMRAINRPRCMDNPLPSPPVPSLLYLSEE